MYLSAGYCGIHHYIQLSFPIVIKTTCCNFIATAIIRCYFPKFYVCINLFNTKTRNSSNYIFEINIA